MPQKTTLVIATKNKDKCRELQTLLKNFKIKVLSLSDFPKCPDVVEDGKTFEANAKKKARVYSKITHSLVIADDSGLMVNCLNGKPGVYSARFAGPGCTYLDNNKKLLKLLKDKPVSKRAAKFVSVIAIYDNGQLIDVVRGQCRGMIAFEARGQNGFGYDPVFIPQGFKKTFSELSPETKNKISHRGQALRAAKKVVLSLLATR